MKNRLVLKMQELKRKRQKAFCAFLTLGYPNQKASGELIERFEQAGVDIVELGFPFSDPMADGPTIQYSSEQALKRRVRVEDAFNTVKRLRARGVKVPILFFTYLNPIFHYGLKRFAARAAAAGFDGVIVPDLPPESESEFNEAVRRHKLCSVFLAAPTSTEERVSKIAARSSGFIYYVSLRGVTGARKVVADDLKRNLRRFKSKTRKPVLIGFGVSSPEQARKLSAMSEGVIVGSAIVEKLRASGGRLGPAVSFVGKMVRAVKGRS